MQFDAIYTFKNQSTPLPDVSFHVSKGGLPTESQHMISSLVRFANQVWAQQEKLSSLRIPGVSTIEEISQMPATQYRYEVHVLEGRPNTVVTMIRDVRIPEDLQGRYNSALAALELIKQEMQEAAAVPHYREQDRRLVTNLSTQGFGY